MPVNRSRAIARPQPTIPRGSGLSSTRGGSSGLADRQMAKSVVFRAEDWGTNWRGLRNHAGATRILQGPRSRALPPSASPAQWPLRDPPGGRPEPDEDPGWRHPRDRAPDQFRWRTPRSRFDSSKGPRSAVAGHVRLLGGALDQGQVVELRPDREATSAWHCGMSQSTSTATLPPATASSARLIAVSARTEDQLDETVSAIEQAAVQASCEIRRPVGQQAPRDHRGALALCRKVRPQRGNGVPPTRLLRNTDLRCRRPHLGRGSTEKVGIRFSNGVENLLLSHANRSSEFDLA